MNRRNFLAMACMVHVFGASNDINLEERRPRISEHDWIAVTIITGGWPVCATVASSDDSIMPYVDGVTPSGIDIRSYDGRTGCTVDHCDFVANGMTMRATWGMWA